MSNDSEVEAEAADGGDEEAEQSQEETGLQEDDFVLLDYTARTTDDGTLVDTTDPEVAEEEDVDADQEFAPSTMVRGANSWSGSTSSSSATSGSVVSTSVPSSVVRAV